MRVRFRPVYVAFAGLALLFAGFYGILYVMVDADYKGVWEEAYATILTVSVALMALGLQLLSAYLCTLGDLDH